MVIDTTEWETMATRRELKIKGAIVLALIAPLIWLTVPDATSKAPGLMWAFCALFSAIFLFLLWGMVRPAERHPFIKVLRSRREDVTKSYAYELHINGRYSATLLVLMLKDGKHVSVNLPRNEIPVWQPRLQALLPSVEHLNEVAPI